MVRFSLRSKKEKTRQQPQTADGLPEEPVLESDIDSKTQALIRDISGILNKDKDPSSLIVK